MKSCKDIRLLLARRATNGLSPEEEALLARHLAGCAACRAASEDIATFVSGMREFRGLTFRPSQAARQSLLAGLNQGVTARLPVSGRSSRRVSSRVRSARVISSRRQVRSVRTRFAVLTVAAAAVVALAVSLALHFVGRDGSGSPTAPQHGGNYAHGQGANADEPNRDVLAVIEKVQGEPTVTSMGRTRPAGEGGEIRDGDLLETGRSARVAIRYPDGSTVEVDCNARMRVFVDDGAKRLSLDRGAIFAQIAKQPAGRALIINPWRSDQLTVVGTVFELIRQDDSTRLHMVEGLVRFGPPQQAVAVGGNETSSVEDDGPPSAPQAVNVTAVAPWRLAVPIQPVQEPAVADAEAAPGHPVPDSHHPGSPGASSGNPAGIASQGQKQVPPATAPARGSAADHPEPPGHATGSGKADPPKGDKANGGKTGKKEEDADGNEADDDEQGDVPSENEDSDQDHGKSDKADGNDKPKPPKGKTPQGSPPKRPAKPSPKPPKSDK